MSDSHLAAARRAALGALQSACERNVVRSEIREIECYSDAWARYALSLEERLQPPPQSAAPAAGGGQRPHPLPPQLQPQNSAAPQESEQPAARPDGERFCALAAATLQQSLGVQAWQWHDEHAGETASVPLCWLTQIEEGVRLLQGAAKREPTLLRQLAEQRVRADAAEELSVPSRASNPPMPFHPAGPQFRCRDPPLVHPRLLSDIPHARVPLV